MLFTHSEKDEQFNMQDFLLPGNPVNRVNHSGNRIEKLNGNAYIDDSDVFIYPSDMDISDHLDDVYSIINYHENNILPKYQAKADYYKGRHLRIIEKPNAPVGKPDSRLIINFPKKLVDTFNGFCNFGDIQVSTKDGNDKNNDLIQEWLDRSDFDNFISELSKQADIFGRAYLYAFDNGENIEITACPPLDTIVVYDDTVQHNPLFAIRYSTNNKGYEGTIITDSKDYSFGSNYEFGSVGKSFSMNDKNSPIGITNEHEDFPYLPVIELRENDERIGIFDDVINLIDSINITNSNKNNDTDSYKNNYLMVTGLEMDKDQVNNMNKNNFINLYPKNGKYKYNTNTPTIDPKAEFINPQPNDEMQENTLNRNIDLIYQIAQVVDMNDSKLGGNVSNVSGTALMQRYQTMKAKAETKEKKLKFVLRRLFSIVFAHQNIDEDVLNLDFAFNLSIPHNTVEETQAFSNVYGKLPPEEALKLLSFVSDNTKTAQEMHKESQTTQQQTEDDTNNALEGKFGDQ